MRREFTYRDLNDRADTLARRLRRLGVGPETPVGVCLERSVEMVVGLLAILKAGGAYVPLDPAFPQQRLARLLADTQAPVVLVHRHLAARLPAYSGRVVVAGPDGAWEEAGASPGEAAVRRSGRTAGADGLAYILYTSGSTGQPKGVCVTHRNVVRLVEGTDYIPFGPHQVFLQLAPLAFDASTFEIWGSLLRGAAGHPPAPGAGPG